MISSTAVGWRRRLGSLIAAALTLPACAPQTTQPDPAEQQATNAQTVVETKGPSGAGIGIDGSSTVYPITERVVQEFRKTAEGANVSVDAKFSGTSAGFRRFCAGETDISGASRPILVKEIEVCNKEGVRFVELPVAFDALTLAVHPQNTWASDITIAELQKIWAPTAQGKITRWNQVRPSYPDRPLKLFGAGKDSGTFDYFNEVTTGKPKESRTDYTDSEDDNVLVEGIAADPNTLGYIPFAYYEANQNRLKGLAIDNGKGPVTPSRETVEQAKYQPFSRPLFIYVNVHSTRKPEVQAFVEFYLKNAKSLVAAVGYIPLPEEGYHLASVQFYKGEVGTVFEGVPQPDVTIAELLRRQAVFQLTQK
jgi:phosphate transport system substrate-binding protein